MIKTISLLVLLAPALAFSPTLPAQEASGEDGAAQDPPPAAQAPPATTPPAADKEPSSGRRDPSEYQASEQISEDLSVSFPVDI